METVFDFHQAYLEGITTPSQVAQRFLDVVRSMEESAVPLKPMVEWDSKEILKQAEISTKRSFRAICNSPYSSATKSKHEIEVNKVSNKEHGIDVNAKMVHKDLRIPF